MPNEPERDIEKLLRTCAEKRRDEAGAPLELHPATRRMLHGEVARRTAKAARAENIFAKMLSVLRPRLAFGIAILAVLLIATWALLPSLNKTRGELELARSDAPSPAGLVRTPSEEAPMPLSEMNVVKPKMETRSVATDLTRTEQQLSTVSGQRAGAWQDSETGREMAATKAPGGDKGMTASSTQTAWTATDKAKAAFVTEAAMPMARPDEATAFRTGYYGLAGSRALPASEPGSVASLTVAVPERSAARSEMRIRDLSSSDNLRRTKVLRGAPGRIETGASPAAAALQTDLNQVRLVSVTQRFVQLDPRLQTAPAAGAIRGVAPAEILASFQMTQAGEQIRIIDGDGSTYAGSMRPVVATALQPDSALPETARSGSVSPTQALGAAEDRSLLERSVRPAPAESLEYSFQVEGTNRTLNQRVVFNGSLITDGSTISAIQSNTASDQRGAVQFQQGSTIPSQLQNFRISGQAVIGGGRTIEINAGPVAP